MIDSLFNDVKKKKKDIPPEKLKEYKRKASVLATAYGLSHKVSLWWVDIEGETRLIVHNPDEKIHKWIRDRIDNDKEEKE